MKSCEARWSVRSRALVHQTNRGSSPCIPPANTPKNSSCLQVWESLDIWLHPYIGSGSSSINSAMWCCHITTEAQSRQKQTLAFWSGPFVLFAATKELGWVRGIHLVAICNLLRFFSLFFVSRRSFLYFLNVVPKCITTSGLNGSLHIREEALAWCNLTCLNYRQYPVIGCFHRYQPLEQCLWRERLDWLRGRW